MENNPTGLHIIILQKAIKPETKNRKILYISCMWNGVVMLWFDDFLFQSISIVWFSLFHLSLHDYETLFLPYVNDSFGVLGMSLIVSYSYNFSNSLSLSLSPWW